MLVKRTHINKTYQLLTLATIKTAHDLKKTIKIKITKENVTKTLFYCYTDRYFTSNS